MMRQERILKQSLSAARRLHRQVPSAIAAGGPTWILRPSPFVAGVTCSQSPMFPSTVPKAIFLSCHQAICRGCPHRLQGHSSQHQAVGPPKDSFVRGPL